MGISERTSVLTTLSASAILGEQAYGPYGNQRYMQGTMGTDKGYTGQFQDALISLDYYNARYYDPIMGQFLSADEKQGSVQGMNPYAYVAENPDTNVDPTGHCAAPMATGVQPMCASGGSQPTPPPPI